MSDEDLDAHVAASARVLDIELPPGAATLIAAQLRVLLDHAANLAEYDLPPGLDPLPVFEP
jgi:hypothetical protein